MEDAMRLTLEIVPPYVSDRGLSYTLPKARWNRIRRGVAEAPGNRCAACGFGGRESPLQCHEVWDYDLDTLRSPTPDEIGTRAAADKAYWAGAKSRETIRRGIRRLIDLVPLCGPCHRAKHSDRSCFMLPWMRRDLAALGRKPELGDLLREALAREGDHFPNRSLARFAEVNHGVPMTALEEHCLEACALLATRRDVEWASDYNGFDLLGQNG